MFIVSLAVADLTVGLVVMPISTIYIFTGDWLFGVAVCQIWIGIDYTASTASILNLFILSLDRYWSVRAPLQYLHKRTRRRALSMISVVWVASSLWVIPIVGWHMLAHGGVRTVPSNVCDTEYARDSVFKVVTAFFNFYLPLSVMYGLYIRIFLEIRKRSQFELGQRNPGRRRLSYHVKSNPVLARGEEGDSDGHDDDTFTDDHSSRERMTLQDMTSVQRLPLSGSSRKGSGRLIRENGARAGSGPDWFGRMSGNAGRGNLRLLAMRRQMGQREASTPLSPSVSPLLRQKPRKVEYVYDENVLDPTTEKLERYYYEDHVDRRCFTVKRSANRSRTPRASRTDASAKSLLLGQGEEQQRQDREGSPVTIRSPFGDVFVHIYGGGRACRETSRNVVFNSLPGNCPKSKQQSSRELSEKMSVSCEALARDCGVGSGCDASKECGFVEVSGRKIPGASDLPSPPSSSANSSLEDEGPGLSSNSPQFHCHHHHHQTHPVVDNVSLVRHHLHLADTFSEQAILPATSAEDGSRRAEADDPEPHCKRDVFLLRDPKDRRLTGVLNLRHRLIRNFRVSSSLRKEIKAARQLGVIMGAFTLCFLPYFVMFLVVAFCYSCIQPGLLTAATWVGYLNSTLNPFLYPLCNAAFRRKFRTMLHFWSFTSPSSYNYSDRNSMTRARYD